MAHHADRSGVRAGHRVDHLAADGDRAEQGHRRPEAPESVTQHKDDLSSIKTKLDAFKTAATDLASAATWKATQTTSSSDPTKLDVTLLGGAGIGGHTLADRQARVVGAARLHVHAERHRRLDHALLRDRPERGRQLQAHDRRRGQRDRDRRRDAINANESSPVYAAVIKDGANDERLVLSARKTGESSNFTVDTTAGRRRLAGRGPRVRAHGYDAQRLVHRSTTR